MLEAQIMVLDDEGETLELIETALGTDDRRIHCFSDPREGVNLLGQSWFDIVLTDLRMPGMSGLEVLQTVKARSPQTEVILMTAHGEVDVAVEAMKCGASDFLRKPLCMPELMTAIARLIEYQSMRRRLEDLAGTGAVPIGSGPAMAEVLSLGRAVADTGSTVLLLGETGVGKEVLADWIQQRSSRQGEAYVKINCAALPENLLESELFGHEKGAFTGATERRSGRFERADQGTLFLDEIGEMPMPVQVKLLRVLQTGEFERIGSGHPIRTDFRLICATHRDLSSMIAEGGFREDLFFRVNVFPIEIPPLRHRLDDLPALVYHFLKRARSKVGRGPQEVDREVWDRLTQHDWPGNVRELENVIERACVIAPGGVLSTEHLLIRNGHEPPPRETRLPESFTPPPVPAPRASAAVPWDVNAEDPLLEAEKATLRLVLEQCDWSFRQAADRLKVSRSTLYAKVNRLGITRTTHE